LIGAKIFEFKRRAILAEVPSTAIVHTRN
jgi:hypothetical protein